MQMAALMRVILREPLANFDFETLMLLSMFYAAGLMIALLLIRYGFDLTAALL
jgi:hypothetical protein